MVVAPPTTTLLLIVCSSSDEEEEARLSHKIPIPPFSTETNRRSLRGPLRSRRNKHTQTHTHMRARSKKISPVCGTAEFWLSSPKHQMIARGHACCLFFSATGLEDAIWWYCFLGLAFVCWEPVSTPNNMPSIQNVKVGVHACFACFTMSGCILLLPTKKLIPSDCCSIYRRLEFEQRENKHGFLFFLKSRNTQHLDTTRWLPTQ